MLNISSIASRIKTLRRLTYDKFLYQQRISGKSFENGITINVSRPKIPSVTIQCHQDSAGSKMKKIGSRMKMLDGILARSSTEGGIKAIEASIRK